MTAQEARKEQWNKLKDQPLSAKLKYIFTYYWAAIVGCVCVVIFLTSWIGGVISKKDTAIAGYLLNGYADSAYTGNMRQEFLDHLQLDPKKSEFILTSDIYYSPDEMSDTGVHVLESVAVQATTGNLDFLVSDLKSYRIFSAYLADIRTVLTAEQLEKWDSLFVYVEKAALEELTSGEMEIVQLPEYFLSTENMKDPLPIGIRLPESCKLFDAYTFPTGDIVFGFMRNMQNRENTVAFLEYIMN